jgi:hypothetical protein
MTPKLQSMEKDSERLWSAKLRSRGWSMFVPRRGDFFSSKPLFACWGASSGSHHPDGSPSALPPGRRRAHLSYGDLAPGLCDRRSDDTGVREGERIGTLGSPPPRSDPSNDGTSHSPGSRPFSVVIKPLLAQADTLRSRCFPAEAGIDGLSAATTSSFSSAST